MFGDLSDPRNRLVRAIFVVVAILFVGGAVFCLASQLFFRREITANGALLEIEQGRTARITTRWAGTQIRYPHDDAFDIAYDKSILALEEIKVIEIPWYASGGRGAFYLLCTVEGQYAGKSQFTIRVKPEFQDSRFSESQNPAQTFQVFVTHR